MDSNFQALKKHTMKRFVILATQRSGSTLLWRTLDQHPNIEAHGEMFLSTLQRKDSYRTYLRSSSLHFLQHYVMKKRSVDDYLTQLFRSREDIYAIGFKLMYNHLFGELSRWLKDHDVSIIHLIRKNLLKAILSRETARERNLYHAAAGKRIPQVKITLDPQRLIRDLEGIRKEISLHRKSFYDLPHLEVYYEDVLSNREHFYRSVFDFLDVENISALQEPLKKINPDSVDDLLSNSQEVRQALLGTPFEEYLK